MQHWIVPFFFVTCTKLESHWGCLHGCMNPALRSFLTLALTAILPLVWRVVLVTLLAFWLVRLLTCVLPAISLSMASHHRYMRTHPYCFTMCQSLSLLYLWWVLLKSARYAVHLGLQRDLLLLTNLHALSVFLRVALSLCLLLRPYIPGTRWVTCPPISS